MEISYFKDFVILAETQNYWAAAERLFIGQSSLSKHIKTLEKGLGAPLFDRTSRKVELTEFGRKMLPYAQSVAKLQYEYEAAAFNFLHEESETLHVASIPAMAHYGITDILIRFQLDFPSVRVCAYEADTLEVRERLLDRRSELAFFRDSVAYLEHDPDKESRLTKVPFFHDTLVAVLPKDHPLAGEKSLELRQLAEECFAFIKEGSMPYTLCMRACREAGFTPQVLFTSHNLEALLDMVSKGSCVSLLFAGHVQFPHNATFPDGQPFAVVPVTPEIQTTVYLGYLKNVPLSPAAVRFVEYCTLPEKSIPIRQE